MKSNRGMGMIQLIISIIVIAIIAALGVYFLRMKYEQAKVQTAKTDMLLVEWKAKDAIEKQTVKGEEKVYIDNVSWMSNLCMCCSKYRKKSSFPIVF